MGMVGGGTPPRPRDPVDGQSALAALTAEYDADRDRWRSAFEAAGIGGFEWDLRTSELVWHDRLDRVLGTLLDDGVEGPSIAEVLGSLVHEDDVAPLAAEFRRVVAEQRPFDLEFRLRAGGDDAPRWVRTRGRVVSDPDGRPTRLLGAAYESTDRHEESAQAERRAARDALLAHVTAELTQTLDTDETAVRLTRLVVPELADWCLVTLVSPREPGPDWMRLRDIAWWHPDRSLRPGVALLGSLRPKLLTDHPEITLDVMSGRPARVSRSQLTEALIALEPGPERDRMAALPAAAGVILPMRAHGRTLGMLSLFWAGQEEPVSGDELRTCLDVAGRAGLALDNARLYERTRRMDEELQKALITTPRQPDHVELAVRYRAAAEAARVGGDWYDAFRQADGSTVLVIGDVVGHDEEAAAAMSQVRGLLRGVAATTGEGPAAILTRLDQAMALLRVGVTATVVAARLAPPDADALGVELTWSNAGHPPPVLLRRDGTVVQLDGGEADLLLGIEPETVRRQHILHIARDEVVLLFTDGLVERRGQSLDEGQELLERALGELSGVPLEELCDELLARLLPRHASDDVAVVALRLR